MSYNMTTRSATGTENPSMFTMETRYDFLSEQLQKFITLDLSDIQEDHSKLTELSKEIKLTYREFVNISTKISSLLLRDGAIEEANDKRTVRLDTKNDINEVILTINHYLSQLRRTNVSCISNESPTTNPSQFSSYKIAELGTQMLPQTLHTLYEESVQSSIPSTTETTIRHLGSDETVCASFEVRPPIASHLEDLNIASANEEDASQKPTPLYDTSLGHLVSDQTRVDKDQYSFNKGKVTGGIGNVSNSLNFSKDDPITTGSQNNELFPNSFKPIQPQFTVSAADITHTATPKYKSQFAQNLSAYDKSTSNKFNVNSNAIPLYSLNNACTSDNRFKSHVHEFNNENNNHHTENNVEYTTNLPLSGNNFSFHSSQRQEKYVSGQKDRPYNEINTTSGQNLVQPPRNNYRYQGRPSVYPQPNYEPPRYGYQSMNTVSQPPPFGTAQPNYGPPRHVHQSMNTVSQPPPYGIAQPRTDSLSTFLLTQDLIQKSITPFDGSATNFWPWINKVQDFTQMLNLTPLQTLQLFESHTIGDPQIMISQKLASTGSITPAEVDDVYDTLVRRYGSSQKITNEILERVNKLTPIKNPNIGDQLEKLYDFCQIILYNSSRCPELGMMNLSIGLNLIRCKLPEFLQREWAKLGQRYEDEHATHPPFKVFVDFIKKQARLQSNKSFETIFQASSQTKKPVKVLKTAVIQEDTSKGSGPPESAKDYCIYHKSKQHPLEECYGFKKLDFPTRKKLIYEAKLCYICLGQHRCANCSSDNKCNICQRRHHTIMHDPTRGNSNKETKLINTTEQETKSTNEDNDRNVSTLCTKICNDPNIEINCSKTLLVEITMKDVPNKTLTAYCIIDEQSNGTLIDDSVLEFFGKSFPVESFKMKFASNNYVLQTQGSVVTGLQVKGVLCDEIIDIDEAITCPNITDTRKEVATPGMVQAHSHTRQYAKFFPELNPNAHVLLLIGRNCSRAMATENLYTKELMEPYVHRCPLGYSLVGKVCKGNNNDKKISVFRTSIETVHEPITVSREFSKVAPNEDIFTRRPDDDHPGLSEEDKMFLEQMKQGVTITTEGNLELPLPFKGIDLPNNRQAVYSRTLTTLTKLKNSEDTLKECIQTMEKNLKANYIEQVPGSELQTSNPTWYLPIFGVNHPKKKKTRLVFDASARYKTISLNDTLLSGPDLNNHLRSVLLKFREKPVAFAADIESMFSTFKVPKEQQDLLRFFWFKENVPSNPLVPYRSTSHLFGCNCSPAIANFALKHCAVSSKDKDNLQPAVEYLCQSFYVDDGVSSSSTPQEAIDALAGAKDILASYNVRLHKIISNNQEVLDHFPSSEISFSDVHDLNDVRVLGVNWSITEDTFSIEIPTSSKPFTRRGILSYNGSYYDPIGFISPLILTLRLFQRKVLPPKDTTSSVNEPATWSWDTELPSEYRAEWNTLINNLDLINQVKLNRCFYTSDFTPVYQDLHIFSDASDQAIGYIIYIRSVDKDNNIQVAFVTACSRVAPRSATSIPRLELCAAAEAARSSTRIVDDLKVKPSRIKLYTDSNIVLGYINNSKKRFTKYVERRVAVIHDHSNKQDWEYVRTTENPADIASRPCRNVNELLLSCWLKGPSFLHNLDDSCDTQIVTKIDEKLPEEIIDKNTVLITEVSTAPSFLDIVYSRVSKWAKIVNIAKLLLKIRSIADAAKQRLGFHLAPRNPSVSDTDAALFLVQQSQKDVYSDVIKTLRKQETLSDNCKISKLSPYLMNDTIRVGGRLKNSDLPFQIKHPLLIPHNHPISTALIQYVHGLVKHQGCHITHNSIISQGFHIENGRQQVRNFINSCIICRKLRAKPEEQLMADLPADRLEKTAPFENTGLDVFGPFFIHDGINTRRSSSTKKIWVVIFTCLPSRAIHLEPLVGMDSSSFSNALRRFISIRGPVKILRSDQGTNFLPTRTQLNQDKIYINELSNDLSKQGIQWILNPPHASHHGGAWERKISSVRRVLEASFCLSSNRGLSRDEFHTLLAEASSIVNNTPLWTTTSDPNDPAPLTPNMLLNLREPKENSQEEFSEKDLLAYGSKRYRRVQYLSDQFWIRWRDEYIHQLNKRQKWRQQKPVIQVGDIVLMRDKKTSRNYWPLARVDDVKIGSDGLVRSVSLLLHKPNTLSEKKYFKRPISEIVLLLPANKQ